MRGHLLVASTRAPFRRAGLAWAVKGSAGAVTVDVCDLDGERLFRLLTEPVLKIRIGQDDGGFAPLPVLPDDFSAEVAQMLIDAEADRRKSFQSAQGGEGTGAGHMTGGGEGERSPAPEPKDEEVKDASSVDPLGTPPVAATDGEESREGTDAGSAAAAAPVDGEKEPESSPKAPVAAQDKDAVGGGKAAGSRRRKA